MEDACAAVGDFRGRARGSSLPPPQLQSTAATTATMPSLMSIPSPPVVAPRRLSSPIWPNAPLPGRRLRRRSNRRQECAVLHGDVACESKPAKVIRYRVGCKPSRLSTRRPAERASVYGPNGLKPWWRAARCQEPIANLPSRGSSRTTKGRSMPATRVLAPHDDGPHRGARSRLWGLEHSGRCTPADVSSRCPREVTCLGNSEPRCRTGPAVPPPALLHCDGDGGCCGDVGCCGPAI